MIHKFIVSFDCKTCQYCTVILFQTSIREYPNISFKLFYAALLFNLCLIQKHYKPLVFTAIPAYKFEKNNNLKAIILVTNIMNVIVSHCAGQIYVNLRL